MKVVIEEASSLKDWFSLSKAAFRSSTSFFSRTSASICRRSCSTSAEDVLAWPEISTSVAPDVPISGKVVVASLLIAKSAGVLCGATTPDGGRPG